MSHPATTHTGPLGSTVHVLRADAGTVAELAAIDWSRHFRRVCLDPVRGLVTLMAPSRLHEDLTTTLDRIVDVAGSALTGAAKGLLSLRLRGRGDPPGTGMEPDCAFYVGERARGYFAALSESEAAADAFVERTAPDLVIEVEITSADEGKAERYGEMGVRELWRISGRTGTKELDADFLALHPGRASRRLDASQVLEGLVPADVCEAVEVVRISRTNDDRTAAVARIVRRRQRASARARGEAAPYHPPHRAYAAAPPMNDAASRESLGGFVKTLTAMTAEDDAHEVYEAWAPSYEADLVEGYGYTAHRIAAGAMAAACPDRTAAILDIGCGTGLVAAELAAKGFSAIDGFDASRRMLAEARAKGVYRRLFEGDVRDPGAIEPDRYDAVIAVGVFGGGHVGPEDLECFARPARMGGPIVLYANAIPYVEDDYPSHLRRLEEGGVWTVERAEQTNYMDSIERPGWLIVARRIRGPEDG